MQFISRKHLMPKLAALLGIWLILVAINFVRAEEAAEKPAEAAGASAEQKANNAEFAQYNKHINKMSQLSGKVEEGQKTIQQLILQKRMGVTKVKSEKGDSADILEVIKKEHAEYLDNREKYNSELREVTYRFPSQGQEISRKYRPFRPKTVVEIEKELGLDGQLSDLKIKVQEKYQVFNPIKKVEEPTPLPTQKLSSERTPASVDDGRIRLSVPASAKSNEPVKAPTHQ
jgi:hypothetical protein